MSWDPFREGDLILDQGMRWSVHTYSIHEEKKRVQKKSVWNLNFEIYTKGWKVIYFLFTHKHFKYSDSFDGVILLKQKLDFKNILRILKKSLKYTKTF